MNMGITFRGYRCFSPDEPATIQLSDDVVALVGVNNSGKSTLLKAFYEMRQVFSMFSTRQDMRQALITRNINLSLPIEVGDPNELFWHYGSADIEIDINLHIQNTSQLTFKIDHKSKLLTATIYDLEGKPVPIGGAWNFVGEKIEKPGYRLGDFKQMFTALNILANCFYYPSIRHATPFTPERTKDAYNVGSKYYDINTGKPFIDQWALGQQGTSKMFTEKTDAVVEDIRRIFGYNRLSIQADSDHRELLVVANGKSSRLSELGTGIAQFILLLGNISFAKPSYILIDEPESNLHPSLQLDFLSAVVSRASSGIIFATHNLSLARQASDRLFAFSQTTTGCRMSPFNKTENLAKIIGELSFGRSDFAPGRKLLLVEGQTDVLVMQNLLAIFGKEHEFAIISLGGTSGIHPKRKFELEHMLALGLEIVAIIDSERSDSSASIPKQRLEFQQMCKLLNINCHILEKTAIENYFTQRAIDTAFGLQKYSSFGNYGVNSARWSKNWNWRVARASRKSEIENTDLGKILASL